IYMYLALRLRLAVVRSFQFPSPGPCSFHSLRIGLIPYNIPPISYLYLSFPVAISRPYLLLLLVSVSMYDFSVQSICMLLYILAYYPSCLFLSPCICIDLVATSLYFYLLLF